MNTYPEPDHENKRRLGKRIFWISQKSKKIIVRHLTIEYPIIELMCLISQREFDSIRKELREKSSQLLDAELKLNQTSTRMHEQQLENFKNSQQLVNAENQVGVHSNYTEVKKRCFLLRWDIRKSGNGKEFLVMVRNFW